MTLTSLNFKPWDQSFVLALEALSAAIGGEQAPELAMKAHNELTKKLVCYSEKLENVDYVMKLQTTLKRAWTAAAINSAAKRALALEMVNMAKNKFVLSALSPSQLTDNIVQTQAALLQTIRETKENEALKALAGGNGHFVADLTVLSKLPAKARKDFALKGYKALVALRDAAAKPEQAAAYDALAADALGSRGLLRTLTEDLDGVRLLAKDGFLDLKASGHTLLRNIDLAKDVIATGDLTHAEYFAKNTGQICTRLKVIADNPQTTTKEKIDIILNVPVLEAFEKKCHTKITRLQHS